MRIWTNIIAVFVLAGLTAYANAQGIEHALPIGVAAIVCFLAGAAVASVTNSLERIMRPPEFFSL
ncbi:hypothetical protein [Shimia haliotis]|uniref:Uncharacterized protein n=1 Tax=Shimia haliotis TaxID=1280847 RepID=A0A1I4B494_9RHOB|nr:hypothetical protein [Shimia haliotis]SFK62871.1 hypothetical protein SAMN04488036_101754 [Shimia haliotis]